ncbi:MAG: FkbM family methyltransferase [Putridiphycobacter sp.]|nr:FkbM family methyltransferase [Putridiphycobacter sp.]
MHNVHKIIQFLLKAPKFPGRDFLIERLPEWFISKAKGPVEIETLFGFKIWLDPTFDKNIENVIYNRGVYEQGTVGVLKKFLKTGDTFVDAGANIGFLSLLAAEIVGPTGNVHAFEPYPATVEILEQNKALNNYSQIEIHSFALGNESGQQTIFTENENRGGASIVNHSDGNGLMINVERLDTVEINSKVNVLKIDVEGYEFEVLKGAEQIIKTDRPYLIVEYSVDRNNTISSDKLFHWLQTLASYRLYKLKHGKERTSALVEIKTVADLPVHDNIFCVPMS